MRDYRQGPSPLLEIEPNFYLPSAAPWNANHRTKRGLLRVITVSLVAAVTKWSLPQTHVQQIVSLNHDEHPHRAELIMRFHNHPLDSPVFTNPGGTKNSKWQKKDQNKARNRFRRYPTPDNMIAFNKARARKIHRQRTRESWIKYVSNITCSTSSKEVWNKIRKLSGKYSASPVSILGSNGVSVNNIPDIANTLAETFPKTSSYDNYTTAFQALKRREERG
ncbi:putative RNA-directed DNA polymerase from transposon X-element [Trichonephila clavipes]|nr:putative RNA-directed DNA polymerase from transposon X-element [Trichonephila clavipes]